MVAGRLFHQCPQNLLQTSVGALSGRRHRAPGGPHDSFRSQPPLRAGGSPQAATAAQGHGPLAVQEGSAAPPSTQALRAVDTGQQAPATLTCGSTGSSTEAGIHHLYSQSTGTLHSITFQEEIKLRNT